MFSPMMRKTPDGGIFPVEQSVFVKEIPQDLVVTRRISGLPGTYGSPYGVSRGGYGGGRSSGGYGGGRGGYGGGRSSGGSSGGYTTTWRR